jgi:dUTP pyrophosphatase
MMIEYTRVRESAKPPMRANPSDAGLDVFYCPEDGAITGKMIEPGQSVILPTGLRFGVPHGYMLQVMNRSGVAATRSLMVGAHVVDSGYDGEVFINLHNVGRERQVIESYTKIAQLVMIPVVPFRALESEGGDLYEWHPITISDRGTGALGSTGR